MNYLTAADVRDSGVLLEVNRRLLHPRGLAAEVMVPSQHAHRTLVINDDEVRALRELIAWARPQLALVGGDDSWDEALDSWSDRLDIADTDAAYLRVQDHRDDPEGVIFDDLDDADVAKAVRFEGLLDEHGRAGVRLRKFGWLVQPLLDPGDGE